MTKKKATSPKTAKKHRQTKGELLDEAADLLSRIEDAEVECQKARLAVDDAKEAYKTSKGLYANAVEELRKLARARRQKLPLFDAAGKKAEEEKKAKASEQATPLLPAAEGDTAGNGQAQPLAPEAWRTVRIAELSLKPATESKLLAKDLDTLGALSDWMQKKGEFWAKDVPGIGEKAATDIADAFAAFWATHPECCQPVAEAAK